MLKKLLIAFVGLGGLALTTLPAAAANFVQCPGATMKREITTPLQSGWWQTPVVSGLQSTTIQNVGGKPTLVCRYGAAGPIMHQVPPLQVCQAVSGGFMCTQIKITLPTLAPIYSKGQIDLPQTYLADVDKGHVTQNGADIWYEALNPVQRQLVPKNGALMWVAGNSQKSKHACATGPLSGAAIPFGAIQPGTYICMRTNKGRIAELKVLPFANTTTLRLSYTTWK